MRAFTETEKLQKCGGGYAGYVVVAQVYMEVVVQDMWRWWQQNMWGWLGRLCRGDGAMYVEVVA